MNEEQEVIVNNESGNNPFLKEGYGIWPRLKFLKEENEFLSDQEVYDGDIHKATSISFDPETPATIEEGSVIQLELVPDPNVANVPVCIWETSDETVARVNGQGKIFFYKSGEVTITATDVTDSGVNASFEFTVVEPGVKPEPEPDTRVVLTVDLTSGDIEHPPFTILKSTNNIKSVEIDGEVLSEIVTTYTFETKGEHVIKYELLDDTLIDNMISGVYRATNLSLPDSIVTIEENAFLNLVASTINLPSKVTSVGQQAFSYSKITSINIPVGVTIINNSTFRSCTDLVNVTLSDQTVTISNSAFEGCLQLTSIVLPSTITSINNYAFNGCSALASVTVEATTPPTLGTKDVFAGNAADRKIYVPADSVDTYKAADGWSIYAADIEAIPSN